MLTDDCTSAKKIVAKVIFTGRLSYYSQAKKKKKKICDNISNCVPCPELFVTSVYR